MKNLIVVANWKSYKSPKEAIKWYEDFSKLINSNQANFNGDIILCAPFTDLSVLKNKMSQSPLNKKLYLGAQNLSPFEDGPYTGEVSANMLKGLVGYVMIGHSERRIHFKETEKLINKKIKLAQKYGLKQIVCISKIEEAKKIKSEIPDFGQIILYEPLFAIGSGQTDTPENANKMAQKMKKALPKVKVIYGGSIKPENVAPFFSQPFLDGVTVGGASLESNSFWAIIKHAG